jgi:hypothetical protein
MFGEALTLILIAVGTNVAATIRRNVTTIGHLEQTEIMVGGAEEGDGASEFHPLVVDREYFAEMLSALLLSVPPDVLAMICIVQDSCCAPLVTTHWFPMVGA